MSVIYQNYHNHKSESNIMTTDCAVNIEDYAKRCIELGHKVLSSVEHGWQSAYHKVYETAKKYGLKFIFGSEAYWVKDRHEKDNTNSHIILLAKNENGRRSINRILSDANIDGYYYKPRVDIELLLSLPKDDVFVTSACVAFWKYDDIENIVLKLHNHFQDNFMLEIQYHDTDKQREINKRILQLHNRYGIDIILGCDSHYIYPEQYQDREYLLESKGIKYEDEYGWYHDYPTSEDVVERFKTQGILNNEQIHRCMNNTNLLLEFDDIEFNKEIKLPTLYPNLTQDEKNKLYAKTVLNEFNKIKHTLNQERMNEYIDAMKYEMKTVINTGLADYFLLDYEIVKKAKENGGVISYTSRGSGGSYFTNTLLGFGNLDRIIAPVKLYPDRFISETRILQTRSLADLDLNLGNPEVFVKAQEELLGVGHAYPMIAFGTLKEKSAFKMYAKANNLDYEIADSISKQIEKYEKDLKHADEDTIDTIDILDYIDEQYHDIYLGSEKYRGIISDKKQHACGYIVYQGNIKEELGLMRIVSQQSKKETIVVCVDGYVAEEYKYLKNDLLKVDVAMSIHEIYNMLGIKQPTINEMSIILENDNKTWKIYEKGLTLGVNQMESAFAKQCSTKYKPKTIAELTALVSALRPGFKSMLDNFLNRKPYTTGVTELDNLLKDSFHYVMYQESIMTYLNWLGTPMTECYEIIKKISKKKFKSTELNKLKGQLTKGWLDQVGTIDGFDKTWQIVLDFAKYAFNASHAYAYAYDSAYCAYLKAHHPYEFYCVMLNKYTKKGKKDRVTEFVKEMEKGFNIKLGKIRFGLDNRAFTIDKANNSIHPNLSGIKDIGQNVADELYELSKKNFDNFIDLLVEIRENTSVKTNQMKILISLNYFDKFGKNKRLMEIYNKFEERYKKTHVEKTKIARLEEIKQHAATLSNESFAVKEQLKKEHEYLGYCESKYNVPNNIFITVGLNTTYSPKLKLYNLSDGTITDCKCYVKTMKRLGNIKMYDLVIVNKTDYKPKKKYVDGKYIDLDEKELILENYQVR